MILYNNTTPHDFFEIGVKDKNRFIAKKSFKAARQQAEKLLPAIIKLLKVNRLKLSALEGIEVANQGGSFTSLRIGVMTANALGYGLGIAVRGDAGKTKTINQGQNSFKVVNPLYASEPTITKKKPR